VTELQQRIAGVRDRQRIVVNQIDDLDERVAHCEEEIAHFGTSPVSEEEARAIAYGKPAPALLNGKTRADWEAELSALNDQRRPLARACELLCADLRVLEKQEREERTRLAVGPYKAAVARKIKALVEAGRAHIEAESTREGLSPGRLYPMIMHAVDPHTNIRDNLSALCYAIRDGVRVGILTGAEEWLDGVAWREAGVSVKPPRHVETGTPLITMR
jgi:hypothetical protein